MPPQYKIVNWKFDGQKLAETLATLSRDEMDTVREVMGVSDGAMWHWRNNSYVPPFEYPNMTNFLTLCNWLDLDPREFFILED